MHRIRILPEDRVLEAAPGANLLEVLRDAGPQPEAPCGGQRKCGKCRVWLDGREVLSCKTRIRHALAGGEEKLTRAIRDCLRDLTETLCSRAGIGFRDIGVVSVVGNPAMQQLFLGISPENLVRIPFGAVLKAPKAEPAGAVLPEWGNALLLTVPDISGFVGADTVACVLNP